MLRNKESLRIMRSVLLAVVIMISVMPLLGMHAYAQDQSPEYIGPGQLGIDVNTPSAKAVKFGGKSWYVIGYDGNGVASGSGEVVLLMKDSLQSSPYSNKYNPNTEYYDDPTYKGSTLQTLLDAYVNENFTDGEKQTVIPRELAAMDVDKYNYEWWDDYSETVDEVPYEGVTASAWPLSAKEATVLNQNLRNINEEYWLRSLATVPGPDWEFDEYWTGYLMSVVWSDGDVEWQYWREDLTESKGVRPAIKLKKDNILYITPAGSGEWKLTLKDEAHKNFSVDTCDNTLDLNGDLVIKYQNAVPGDNEYIKYVIKGSDGNFKKYEQCEKVTAASGTITLTGLPKDSEGKISLSEGDKLYVFNEQDNEDTKSNYASEFVEVGTTTGHDWVFSEISNTMYNPVYYARYWCRRDYTHRAAVATTKTEAHIPATCESYGSNTQTYSVTAEQSPDGQAHSRSFGDVDWDEPPLHHDYSIFADVKWTGSVAAYTKAEFIFSCSHDRSHRTSVEGDITTRVEEPTCTGIGRTVYQANLPADKSPDGQRHGSAKYGNAKPSLGHDWNEPTYTWSADNSSVTATRVCKRDSSHVETETVETTMNITTSPTCKATGVAVFTTKPFRNSAFTEQTKTNQEIPIDPDAHEWEMEGEAIGHNECGASIVREKCTLCGKTEETAYGGDNHDFEEAWTYYPEPTCTEGGQRFHKCTKCGVFDFVNFEVLDAKGHQWKFVDFTWTGNETDGYEKAVANYVCETDPSHTTSVDATISEEVINPTCQEGGKTVYTATVSAAVSPDEAEHSESKDANATEKASHEWEYSGMEWSGNETDGYTGAKAKYTCKHNCGQEELVNATITEDETKPTCEDGGKTTYTAKVTSEESFTGEENTDTKDAKLTDALDHDWHIEDVVWTGNEEEGYTKAQVKFVCDNDESHTELVDATITEKIVEPTCLEQGFTLYTALLEDKDSLTGYDFLDYNYAKIKEATGHDWKFKNFTWISNDKYGYSAKARYVCKHDESHIESMRAKIAVEEKAATCEAAGETLYTATVSAKDSLTDTEVKDEKRVEIKATGHDWGDWTVAKEATENEEGEEKRVCSHDPSHVEKRSIPKLKPEHEPTPAKKASGTLMAKAIAKGSKSLNISWTKVQNADGYDIYFARCNANGRKYALKKVKTVKGNKTFKWTKGKLAKRTAYKAVVKAYTIKNGKKTYVRTSPTIHAFTSGYRGKHTNPKNVTVTRKAVNLKKGKTYKIKAKVSKLRSGKRLPSGHAANLRYLSSNKKVATVSKSGKVKAMSKGVCTVYVYAANGVWKTVKVTVR